MIGRRFTRSSTRPALAPLASWTTLIVMLACAGCDGEIQGVDGGSRDASATDGSPIDALFDATVSDAAGDGAADASSVDAAEPVDAGPPCATPLTISPATSSVPPQGFVALASTGGTDRRYFALSRNDSGGRIDESTGVYVAGETFGTDEVIVRDRRCSGEARASIMVTAGLTLTPASADVAASGTVTFRAQGGTEPYQYSIVTNTSGGTIVAATGAYTAGTTSGVDVVRVTDATSAQANAEVRVGPRATLGASVSPVSVPVMSTFLAHATGGSGVATLSIPAGSFTTDGMTLTATMAGNATATLLDSYTGEMATFPAYALAPLGIPSVRSGERVESARAVSADFNNDGFDDVAYAIPSSALAFVNGGAVILYRGTAAGIDPTPASILLGTSAGESFGASLASADVNNDGLQDLFVGAPASDDFAGNSGLVRLHLGVPGPTLVDARVDSRWFGLLGGDAFGAAVATCDVNGDSRQDLIVGAPDAEDRSEMPLKGSQGAVYVFLGTASGIRTEPNQTLYGEVLADGGAGGVTHTVLANLRFGAGLASGDFNDDGRCDIAALTASPGALPDAATSIANDGLVSLYLGVDSTVAPLGGEMRLPALVIDGRELDRATRAGSQLGFTMAFGDVDGDGREDLALGQPAYARDASGGAVRLFRGGERTGTTFLAARTDADWSVVGEAGSATGSFVSIGDVSGDGVYDIVSGDRVATVMGGAVNAGRVRVFQGVRSGLPYTTESAVVAGTAASDVFGYPVVVVRGGNTPSWTFVGISRGDDGGVDVPGAMAFRNRATLETTTITVPGRPGGRRLGQSVTAVDIDADGNIDVVAGAPRSSFDRTDGTTRTLGYRRGSVAIFRGSASGWSNNAPIVLEPPLGADLDVFGEAVANAGDIDNDGHDDLAVVSRADDRPVNTSFPTATYVLDANCTVARNDVGSVMLFRSQTGFSASTAPATIIFGNQTGRVMSAVVGNFDFNEDGRPDIAYGLPNQGAAGAQTGGIGIVFGRAPRTDGRTTVICEPNVMLTGLANGEAFGTAIDAADVDGDGCSDLAIGAPVGLSTLAGEGVVTIFFGYGATCASTGQRMIRYAGNRSGGRAGSAVAFGLVDADAIPDLVVGAPLTRESGVTAGRTYVITGTRMRALLAMYRGAVDGGVPTIPSERMSDVRGNFTNYVTGLVNDERLGTALAVVRRGTTNHVIMGAPRSDASGSDDTGAVRFGRWTAALGLELTTQLISGETDEQLTELGAALSPFTIGARSFVVVGAPTSNGLALPSSVGDVQHEGVAYVAEVF